MKLSRMALAAAIAWGIYAGSAQAQQQGQVATPVAYDYSYYYQPEGQPSPSDQAAPIDPAMAKAPGYAPGYAACAPACDAGCEEEVCEPWRLCCQKECGWNVHGWVNGGIMANFHDPADDFNGPVTFPDRDYGQFNQGYLIAENIADNGGCGWDFGGRVDVLLGSDYFFTQAVGLELDDDGTAHWNQNSAGFGAEYGLALPQFYVQAQYNDWDVKLGHFYTPIGYEVVPATGNFFYTHAYTMQYGEPFTHTGALGAYKYSDTTTLNLGIVNGWDNFDRTVDTAAAIFGFAWDGGEGLTVAWNMILSPNETNINGAQTNRDMYSFVLGRTFGDCDQWQYVFQHDYGWQLDGVRGGGATAEWYGVNQYLFYTINDCWKAGTRFEWFRDDDGVRVTGLRNQNNFIFNDGYEGNFFEVSTGLNWTPSSNLTVRPELRYDWFDGVKVADGGTGPAGGGPFRGGTGVDQIVAGFDVIYLW